jgi:hypothetical protein
LTHSELVRSRRAAGRHSALSSGRKRALGARRRLDHCPRRPVGPAPCCWRGSGPHSEAGCGPALLAREVRGRWRGAVPSEAHTSPELAGRSRLVGTQLGRLRKSPTGSLIRIEEIVVAKEQPAGCWAAVGVDVRRQAARPARDDLAQVMRAGNCRARPRTVRPCRHRESGRGPSGGTMAVRCGLAPRAPSPPRCRARRAARGSAGAVPLGGCPQFVATASRARLEAPADR